MMRRLAVVRQAVPRREDQDLALRGEEAQAVLQPLQPMTVARHWLQVRVGSQVCRLLTVAVRACLVLLVGLALGRDQGGADEAQDEGDEAQWVGGTCASYTSVDRYRWGDIAVFYRPKDKAVHADAAHAAFRRGAPNPYERGMILERAAAIVGEAIAGVVGGHVGHVEAVGAAAAHHHGIALVQLHLHRAVHGLDDGRLFLLDPARPRGGGDAMPSEGVRVEPDFAVALLGVSQEFLRAALWHMGVPPAARIPSFTCLASSRRLNVG